MSTSALGPTVLVRLTMLASSYAPLLFLIAILDSFGSSGIKVLLLAIATVSVVGSSLFFYWYVPSRNTEPERIASVKPRDSDGLKFFASYVVPFFVTADSTPAERWGLLIYIVMIGVLYIQGDLYASNPLIAILGYRQFDVTRTDGGYLQVLSRRSHLVPKQVIQVVSLGGYVYVEASKGRQKGINP